MIGRYGYTTGRIGERPPQDVTRGTRPVGGLPSELGCRLAVVVLVGASHVGPGSALWAQPGQAGPRHAARQTVNTRWGFVSSRGACRTAPMHKGLCISLHADDREAQYRHALDEVADMGSTSVNFILVYYQDNVNSSVISKRPWFPKWATFGRLVDYAHQRGMSVLVLPIVLLENPRTSKEWRGVIDPKPGWPEWFRVYRQHILELAAACQRHRVEVLAVGSELSSAEPLVAYWTDVIANVRRLFGGRLTYSSNWDHYDVVKYWNQLDYVGITAYWELNSQKGTLPSLQSLLARWVPIRQQVYKWVVDVGRRPLIFIEVGYPSQVGCSHWPWNYYGSTVPAMEEQRRCYQAFLATWGDLSWVAAIYMYDWQEQGGPTHAGFTPRGKPAEQVLRNWLRSSDGTSVLQSQRTPATRRRRRGLTPLP